MPDTTQPSSLQLCLAAGPINVRLANDGDADLLRQLFEAEKRPEFIALGLPDSTVDMLVAQQVRARDIGYAQTYPASENWIIEADGVGVGRLLTDIRGDELHLIDMALLPQTRGRGIGANVLRATIAAARCAGLRRVTLNVFAANARAEQLHQRLGFVRVEGDPETEMFLHRMQRDLG